MRIPSQYEKTIHPPAPRSVTYGITKPVACEVHMPAGVEYHRMTAESKILSRETCTRCGSVAPGLRPATYFTHAQKPCSGCLSGSFVSSECAWCRRCSATQTRGFT